MDNTTNMSDETSPSFSRNLHFNLLYNSTFRAAVLEALKLLEQQNLDPIEQNEMPARKRPYKPPFVYQKTGFQFANISFDNQIKELRFTMSELERLSKLLFNEEQFKLWFSKSRLKVDPTTALAIVCSRLAKPSRLTDFCNVTGHSKSWVGEVFNTTIRYLFARFERLLYWDYIRLTPEKLASFAKVIEGSGTERSNIFGFIDGTSREICRPTPNVINQQEVYNEHKKCHCLVYQGITTPDGLLVHLYGPLSGNTHVMKVYLQSNIAQVIRQMAKAPDGTQLKIYGDKGYAQISDDVMEAQIMKPREENLTDAQFFVNRIISGERTCIEWSWGQITQFFSYLSCSRNQQLGTSLIGCQFWVSALLTNCLLCIHGKSKASNKFQSDLPTVEEYLASVDQLNENYKFDEFLISNYMEKN